MTARVLLVIEDNPADADFVSELLLERRPEAFEIHHATRLDEALKRLGELEVDVILLDLRLPDAEGVETLTAVKSRAGHCPIVVLTGNEDEDLALACIREGADDYLLKHELRTLPLHRAIGYALCRRREAQILELQEMLAHYRLLARSSAPAAAPSPPLGAVRERHPDVFLDLVVLYGALLDAYVDHFTAGGPKPLPTMELAATRLGSLGAGPQDLLDIHIAALDALLEAKPRDRSHKLAVEGRLLALEMMGQLVDFYRGRSIKAFLDGA